MTDKQFEAKELIDMLEKEMQTISSVPKDFKSIYSGPSVIYSPPKSKKPIGIMIHEASDSGIPLFKRIGWFKRLMFKCLGIKIEWIENE